MTTEYGGTAESFAWWRGHVVPGARMALFADRELTQPITDLIDTQGQDIPEPFVRADDSGWFRFATRGVYQTIHGRIVGGDGRVYRIDRADIGARVFGVEGQMSGVSRAAHEALESAAAADGKADAARGLILGELERVNDPEGLARLTTDGKIPAGLLPSHTEAFLTWGDYPAVSAQNWPSVVGYRGMGTAAQQGYAPENSLEGMRAYVDLHPYVPGQSVPVLWVDVAVANDGSSLVCRGEMSQAGNIPTLTTATHPQDLTALTARTMRISGSKWGASWPNLPMPSLEDVFAEFAGRALFVLRVSRPGLTVATLWRTVLNYSMEDSVLICGDAENLGGSPGTERIMGLFESTATTAQLQGLAAAGAQWVALHCAGLSPANGPDQIRAARAAGLRVMAFPLTRHYELDRCQQAGDTANPWGVDAVVTPEPLYCRWPRGDASPFAVIPGFGGYAPGQLGNGPAGDAPARARPYVNSFDVHQALHVLNDARGTQTPGELMDPDNRLVYWEHQGWAWRSMYQDNPTTRRFRVELQFQFRGGAPTSWVSVMVGLSDDRPGRYQATGTVVTDGPPGQNGWMLACRADGNLYLRQITGGQLADADAAAVTTGPGAVNPGPNSERRRLRIDLFPDRVEAYLMQPTGSTVHRTLTYADASPAHRGPYVAFGSRQADLLIVNPSTSVAGV